MAFCLITDTSANLPTEYLLRRDIAIIPFTYFYDEQEHTCLDIDAFNGERFYGAIRHGLKVTTSQINPQRFLDAFTPRLQQGQDIVYVGMSSGISGAYQSAVMAAEELREAFPERQICTVDTKAASLGEGLVVMQAARMRDMGMGAQEAAFYLRKYSENVCQVFTVDDLLHLRRTGRLSNASAFVGTVLNIKPVLMGNENGQIIAVEKCRGMKKAIAALAQRYDQHVINAQEQTVCIAHAQNPEGAAELAALLQQNHPPKEVLTVMYEPVTGAHVGPGALALFFVGDDTVRQP